ncbi:hypothetical protein BKA80DRAFT_76621 [Phyllosticta citrichinensis]
MVRLLLAEQLRQGQTTARQERRDRHTGTARKRGRHGDWYKGFAGVRVGGWAAADRSLAWVPPLRVPKLPRPPRQLPSSPARKLARSPAPDLDTGPPPIGLAPTISAQPPAPSLFCCRPVVAAYTYISPLTSRLHPPLTVNHVHLPTPASTTHHVRRHPQEEARRRGGRGAHCPSFRR